MKQLKIIIGENVHDSKILVNDEQVSFVQDITVHLAVDKFQPEVEITFPQCDHFSQDTKNLVKKSLDLLSDIPNITIKYTKIG